MAKFRKVPVIIDAVQVSDNIPAPDWLAEAFGTIVVRRDEGLDIMTLEGVMHANMGDWIIKGVNGELTVAGEEMLDGFDMIVEAHKQMSAEAQLSRECGDNVENMIGGPGVPIDPSDPAHPNQRYTRFRDELEQVINSHSMENGSDTPDFMLAEFLTDALMSFDRLMLRRDGWYGGSHRQLKAQLEAEGAHTEAATAELDRLRKSV